jgi:CheY-like chemotaxis protein
MSGHNGKPAPSLAAVRVLVVDDNPEVRAVLTTLLEAYGASVTSVGSAAEALRVLPLERPDVLLTWPCPGKTGSA